MENKSCVVCGFDKKVHEHHIVRRRDCGTNTDENLVYLCPNHHWIADFGEEEDREEILLLIKKITGKIGKKLSNEEQEILDLKIKVLQEGVWGKNVWDEDFWNNFKETSNYFSSRSWLLGRGCPAEVTREMNDKADKLILIHKIKSTMNYTYA